MSALLKQLAMPVFGNYPPWDTPSKDGSTSESGRHFQPEQIKVQFSVVPTGARNSRDLSASIAPDQAQHVEYFLQFTHPQFMQNIVARLDEGLRSNASLLLELMAKCVQGTGATIWQQVRDKLRGELADGEDTTMEHWTLTLQRYLEEVAGTPRLGDAAIRMLQNSKKPLEMSPDDWFRRRVQVLGYLEGGMLRRRLALPTQFQLNEAAFLGVSKAWQEKYAETHEEVADDQKDLQSAFSSYHAADIRNGTLSKIKKSKEDSKKKPKSSASYPTARRDERRAGYRSGRGYYRREEYRRRDDRRDDRDGGYRAHKDSRRDDHRKDGHKKPPYKRTAREEAHVAEEERRSRSRSARRSRSHSRGRRSRSRSQGSYPSVSRECDEQYHAEHGGSHGEARGNFSYSDDEEDDRPQDTHKSYRQGGYRTFDAPGSRSRKRSSY